MWLLLWWNQMGCWLVHLVCYQSCLLPVCFSCLSLPVVVVCVLHLMLKLEAVAQVLLALVQSLPSATSDQA
jgi:hypothetical protein